MKNCDGHELILPFTSTAARTSQHCEIVTPNEAARVKLFEIDELAKKKMSLSLKMWQSVFFLADENKSNDRSYFDIPILSYYSVSIGAKQKTNTTILLKFKQSRKRELTSDNHHHDKSLTMRAKAIPKKKNSDKINILAKSIIE